MQQESPGSTQVLAKYSLGLPWLCQDDPMTLLLGDDAGLDRRDAVLGDSLYGLGLLTMQLPFFVSCPDAGREPQLNQER